MGIENYGKIEQGRHKKLRRRITAVIIAVIAVIVFAGVIGILAGDTEGYRESVASIKENHELKARIAELEEQVGELQSQLAERDDFIASMPTVAPTPYAPQQSETPDSMESAAGVLESPRD